MFCYTGITGDVVDWIVDERNVYMTREGRISMAGLNTGNVEHVADVFAEALSKQK